MPFLYQTFYNFRNLKNDTIDLSNREVYFVGENGQGKSNILESLYYAGIKCLMEGAPSDIGQWMPYEGLPNYSTSEALGALVSYLEANNATSLCLGTEIIIVPGYKFKVVDVLVTNFHQPQSTLLLLISAFLDGDWKRVYEHALDGGYRFLSYGDSSLLFRRSPEE